jgi:hypothetical protein
VLARAAPVAGLQKGLCHFKMLPLVLVASVYNVRYIPFDISRLQLWVPRWGTEPLDVVALITTRRRGRAPIKRRNPEPAEFSAYRYAVVDDARSAATRPTNLQRTRWAVAAARRCC